jgi:hypothetical protein
LLTQLAQDADRDVRSTAEDAVRASEG